MGEKKNPVLVRVGRQRGSWLRRPVSVSPLQTETFTFFSKELTNLKKMNLNQAAGLALAVMRAE